MNGAPASPKQDDVRALLDDLAAIKEALRDISRQLLRIERRAKLAIPVTPGTAAVQTRGFATEQRPRLNEDTAQKLVDDLKDKVSRGEQVETRLKSYSVKPELQVVARILGITNTKLPPKDELIRRISTRLRQSVSVMTGIHTAAGGRDRKE